MPIASSGLTTVSGTLGGGPCAALAGAAAGALCGVCGVAGVAPQATRRQAKVAACAGASFMFTWPSQSLTAGSVAHFELGVTRPMFSRARAPRVHKRLRTLHAAALARARRLTWLLVDLELRAFARRPSRLTRVGRRGAWGLARVGEQVAGGGEARGETHRKMPRCWAPAKVRRLRAVPWRRPARGAARFNL